MKISIDDVKKLGFKKLNKIYDEEDSNRILDVIMHSEISGRYSHGLIRLVSGYYDNVNAKRQGKPLIKPSTLPNVLKVDGNFNCGMLVLSLATDQAIKLGKQNAISLVGTNNTSSTSGYVSYYLNKIAKQGLIGIIFVRAGASVAGFGSKTPLFGTNPIGFAIPNDENLDPLIFDLSTSAITYGGLMNARVKCESIPEGVAYDQEGIETTDPEKAMRGATLPFDKGYKGAGLAMMAEILAGIFTGAGFGKDLNSDSWGNLIITIQPDLFISKSEFTASINQYIDFIKSKNNNSRLPGEKSGATYKTNIANGFIDVDEEILKKL